MNLLCPSSAIFSEWAPGQSLVFICYTCLTSGPAIASAECKKKRGLGEGGNKGEKKNLADLSALSSGGGREECERVRGGITSALNGFQGCSVLLKLLLLITVPRSGRIDRLFGPRRRQSSV